MGGLASSAPMPCFAGPASPADASSPASQVPDEAVEHEANRARRSALEPAGVNAVLDQLLPERVPVDPEDLGRPDLVAARLAQDGAEQGLLDEADHQVVEGRA